MREAGDRTTWTAPDEDYEEAVHAAVDAAFDDPRRARGARRAASPRIAGAGLDQRAGRQAAALTVPGVPDVYQGSELWEQCLVDPDNRRPVDFAARDGAARRHRRTRSTTGVDDAGAAKLRGHPRGADAAARPARAVHQLRRRWPPRARRPTTCSPSTAAARSPSPPGCRSASPAAAAGATPRSAARPGSWTRRAHGRTLHRRRVPLGRPARRPTRSPCSREEDT